MSLLTPSAAKGQPFFEAASALRQHDNASDNMAGGAYSHNPLEGSATEADEWTSIILYLFQVAKSGGGALAIRNTSGGTLNAGPVRVTGYEVTNSAFLLGAADAAGNSPAHALLLANLANNTNGTAYLGGTFTSGIDTSASAIGNPVYLTAGGGVTLTAPAGADQIQQVIGRVQTLANPGVVSGLITAPAKLGTSWFQANAVTSAKIGSGAAANGQLLAADGAGNSAWQTGAAPSGAAGGDLGGSYPNPAVLSVADVATGVLKIANGGTNSPAAMNNNQLISSSGGKIGELGAMTDGQMIVGKSSSAPQIVTPAGLGDVGSVSNVGAIVLAKVNGNSFPSGFVTGDLSYGSAANTISRLARGSNGQMLQLQSGIPAWANALRYSTATTVTGPDDCGKMFWTTTSGATTVALPAASTAGAGFFCGFIKADADAAPSAENYLIVNRAGADTINTIQTGIVLTRRYASIILQSDGTSNWTVLAYSGDPYTDNIACNTMGEVAQRPNSATLTNNNLVYGACDRWRCGTNATTTTAGTVQQDTASGSRTAYAVKIVSATTTGTTGVYFRQFIEAKDAIKLRYRHVMLSAWVKQDTGGSVNYVLNVYKANNTDFGSVTTASTATTNMTSVFAGSNQSVATGTWTQIYMPAPQYMGDCANGVMIEIQAAGVSAFTTKNFWLSDVRLSSSALVNDTRDYSYQEELRRAQRYCYVSDDLCNYFGVFQNTGFLIHTISFPVPMRVPPSFTNNVTANAGGAPTGTQFGPYSYAAGGYITGTLSTDTANAISSVSANIVFAPTTTWGVGAAGQLLVISYGSGVKNVFDSDF